ncbi:GPW/gp25 family protein [uncultured Ruegeria sp.]|uniref:GPW/gp25 family protein n=1 Tax=uncultured Ruegeria sp. TaxID=259304 RepID=UPI00262C3899|nr:GPW/gp25 family protein [uncultured Ruegeria sp.]
MMTSKPGFLGRGWNFPPRFTCTKTAGGTYEGRATMVEAETDIAQSLDILMYTILGERVMRPTYGLGLQLHVFDSTDETDLTFLRSRIEKAVVFYEDRIRIETIEFGTEAVTEGRLDIHIDYLIPSTNSRGNRVFPYYIHEGSTLDPKSRVAAALVGHR